MDIIVKSKYIKTSSSKLRLLTNLVKNLNVNDALDQLTFSSKMIKDPVIHLIKSGISAAKNKDLDTEKLYIKSIICNQGPALKRMQYKPRGRAARIKKRTSHITLVISTEENIKNKTTNLKKSTAKHNKE